VVFDLPPHNFIHYVKQYYISKVTGDVIDNLDRPPIWCYRVTFPALRKIQKQIMAQTGATFASEKQQRLGLHCFDE
jgi:hypothetical protein